MRTPGGITLCALAALAPGLAGAASLGEVVTANRNSVVYVKVEKASDSTGAVTELSGTGFIVNDDGFVITAQHVVAGGPGVQINIMGATASSYATLEPMEVLAENSNFDVAILRFKNTAAARQPVTLGDPWRVNAGDNLYAAGFPSKEEWFYSAGTMSGNGEKGSWSTTAILNPGMSGGPIFNASGQVVAMVWGGVGTTGIKGINRVLPVNLFADMLKIIGAAAGPQAPASPVASQGIETVYRVDQVQNSLNGLKPATSYYPIKFHAKPGYKIVDYTYVARSANNASTPDIKLTGNGQLLHGGFTLTSGPLYDRWRGWLDADIRTRQIPLP